MKLSFTFLSIGLLPALAAVPPGVTTKPAPGHANITLYERPSTQARPSFWDAFYKLFSLPNGTTAVLPFQRSVAVLVGIGHYQFITPKLEYVSRDVEKMRDYLLTDGGFDAVYVMDEGVSPEVVKIFMTDEMPKNLKPDDRLLFYYSGHGADPGTKIPVLLFQQARPGQFGQNTLRVDEFEQWSGLLKVKHALFIYDACTAGEATGKDGSQETRMAVTELSGNGSRMVVTAGTAAQQAWVVPESATMQKSIFTDALLRALQNGTAESKERGFITIGQAVEEARVILAQMTSHLGPGHEMKPKPVDIDSAYTGTFVFLHPNADHPVLPQADIRTMGIPVPKGTTGVRAGTDLDKQMELTEWQTIDPLNDPQLYAKFCSDFPNGTLCAAAKKKMEKLKALASTAPPSQDLTKLNLADLKNLADQGSRDALTQLGKAYESGLQGAPVDLQASLGFYKRASDQGDGDASYRIGQIYYYGRKGVPKDNAQAVLWYRKAADEGNVDAMTSVGFMYERGQGGLAQDDGQAVIWYRKAADAGDGTGMADLGVMYEHGWGGLPKDEAQAVSLYRKAADAGDGTGMADLGVMYEHGRGGLPKDEAQAVSLYRKAADAGDGGGMADLGVMYEYGRGGLPKDEAQAVSWYRKAADAGDGRGMADLGVMYEYGRGGLPKDEAQAVIWYRKAADAGDGHGMADLGVMFEHGWGGLPKDEAQAVSLYRKAADAGDGGGMADLGVLYEHGRGGLPKDEAQAVSLYRKAADAGDGGGMSNLGVMYEYGRGGLPKDEAQAVSLYRKATDAGNGSGMSNLGVMYEHGRGGLPKDEAQAVSLYRKAADAGNGSGMSNLGVMYEQGRGGLPKDDAQAVNWYRKGADAGDPPGMAYLGEAYEKGQGGTPKDQTQAVSWYQKAAQLGSDYAQGALKRLGR